MDAGLPPGWTAHFNDHHQEWYYHYKVSGVSTWEKPVLETVAKQPAASFLPPLPEPIEPVARDAPSGYRCLQQPPMHSFSSPDPKAKAVASNADPKARAAPARPSRVAQDDDDDEDPWRDYDNEQVCSLPASVRPKSVAASTWSSSNSYGGSRDRARSRHRFAQGAVSCAADGQWQPHVPCLLDEAVQNLMDPSMRQPDGKNSGVYVDCTFGRGGHTQKILDQLSEKGRLFSFDVDPEAVAEGRKLEKRDHRFTIVHRPFGDLAEVFEGFQLNGVLADLGVSSPQLDDRHRGFNVTEAGPLDLRMNQQQGIPARQWLHEISAEELAWVIRKYGEDHDPILAERIAEYILARQKDMGGQIPLTTQLSDIVKQAKVNINDSGMHPSKLTFQAIRIFLNQEMQQLDCVLNGAMDRLVPEGRCCIISFKKMEQEAVTKFVREHEEPDHFLANRLDHARLCELFPLIATEKTFAVKQLCEPIRPSPEELARNTRSRSSAVHVLMKVQRRDCGKYSNCVPRPLSERFVEPAYRPLFVGGRDDRENISDVIAAALDRQPPSQAPPQVLPQVSQSASSSQSATPYLAPPKPVSMPPPMVVSPPRPTTAYVAPQPRPIPITPPKVPSPMQPATTSSLPQNSIPLPIPVANPAKIQERDCVQNARPEPKENILWVGRAHQDHFPNIVDQGERVYNGYLTFIKDEHLGVTYEGKQADEIGWAYGKLMDPGSPAVQGWFPINRVMVTRWPLAPHEAG